MKNMIFGICVSLFIIAGCATSEPTTTADIITVEGKINQRGNTPFQALMIETPDRNLYILKTDSSPADFSGSKQYSVTGRLYLDQWNGTDYAHLEVISIEESM